MQFQSTNIFLFKSISIYVYGHGYCVIKNNAVYYHTTAHLNLEHFNLHKIPDSKASVDENFNDFYNFGLVFTQ